MAKLHELLAVRESARGQAEKTRTGLMDTFHKKRHLFEEKLTTFTPNTEGAVAKTETASTLQSTIAQELNWLTPMIAGAINVETTVDIGNLTAKADIILETGEVMLTAVPCTSLLWMEKRFGEIKQLVEAIPTLDPAKGFTPAPDRGTDVYVAREVTKNRTSKEQRPIVLYDATDKHPAQTQLITQDVVVGTIREMEWSGLITPAAKADMIARVERLIRAISAAIARANDIEVTKKSDVGEKLLKYVFTGA